MELLWNEFGVKRLIYSGIEQTQVDESISLPEEMRTGAMYDTAIEVLDYSADVTVDNCRAESGKINVDGRIRIRAVLLDEREKPYAFNAEVHFENSSVAEGVDSGMEADVQTSIKSLSLRGAGGSQLAMSALVELEFNVSSSGPLKVLSGISGIADLEIKTVSVAAGRRVELANETVRLSEEIASDGADDVLIYNALVSIRDTNIENGKACINGIVTLNALCRNDDGELIQLVRNIPFRESIEMNGGAEEIFTSAQIENLSVRALGTEFSLISFEADVRFRVYGMRRGRMEIPVDAFSPSMNFNCLIQKVSVLNSEGGSCIQHSVRENLTVPDGMPDIFTALNASVCPIVTSVGFANGEMQAEGLLSTRFIYRSSQNKLYSFVEEVPFSFTMAIPSGADKVKLALNVQPNVTGGGGRTAQVSYSIDASAEFMSVASFSAVAGIAEVDADIGDETKPKGIIIYNACDGETTFDVARRFGIPSSKIASLNKELGDTYKDGDKLILIV